MGTHILAVASTAKPKTGGSSELLLLALIFAVMVLFMFRSSRRRKQMAQDTQRQVAAGARVRTTFGVFGTVIDNDQADGTVIIEIAPGVQIKILRQAIATVLPDDVPDEDFQPVPDLDGDTASVGSDDRSDKSN
jgi:preprotein translocase YajC subunit